MKKFNEPNNNSPDNTEGSSNNNSTVLLPSHAYQIKSTPELLKQLSQIYNYETVILGQLAKKSDADLANANLSEEI